MGKAAEFEKLHTKKRGTPTMGGIILITSVLLMVLFSVIIQQIDLFGVDFRHNLWNRRETYLVLFTLVSVGIIGAIDDYLNVREIGRTKGLSAQLKMILLIFLALFGAWWFFSKLEIQHIILPIFGEITI